MYEKWDYKSFRKCWVCQNGNSSDGASDEFYEQENSKFAGTIGWTNDPGRASTSWYFRGRQKDYNFLFCLTTEKIFGVLKMFLKISEVAIESQRLFNPNRTDYNHNSSFSSETRMIWHGFISFTAKEYCQMVKR